VIPLTRRTFICATAGAVALLTARRGNVAAQPSGVRIIVIGAGVFGAWTAWYLLNQGHSVRLLDAWGPAHNRASSGGESRMTRTEYGGDELYTRMAWESLDDWRWLSSRAGLPIFHPIGALFFFASMQRDLEKSIALHERLGIPLQILRRPQLVERYPQISWEGVDFGVLQPQLGALMARRAVQTLVREFVAAGGSYEQAAVLPPRGGAKLEQIETGHGAELSADRFVFACGPWLPKLFPQVIGRRILPVRMEVFYFATEAGDTRFAPQHMPCWADATEGYFYGFPDLEARGFKVAHDAHGPVVDPDTQDRQYTPARLAEARGFLALRFPSLAQRPITQAEVCQYELTDSADFLVDRHPDWTNVWLVGGGSGHGFKHGPAVGRYAAALVEGQAERIEPRFSLARKEPRLTP